MACSPTKGSLVLKPEIVISWDAGFEAASVGGGYGCGTSGRSMMRSQEPSSWRPQDLHPDAGVVSRA
ncbi:MAG TPA: hypothetical protein VN961_07525, partial [Streptosporangiaceae bacterium]|nr:hypothetical protein [Streptosporangiaceae bacterium]